jgi:uncharacterized protein
MRQLLLLAFVLLSAPGCSEPAPERGARPPILDMHLHAHTLGMYGSPPPAVCSNDQEISLPAVDPKDPLTHEAAKACGWRRSAPVTDEELLRTSLETLERYNIKAVTSGPLEEVQRWRAAAPDRIIPAVPFDEYERREPEVWRRLAAAGTVAVFGEISPQYHGLSPADPSLEPYFALAEELDVPVGIHLGESSPGAAYLHSPRYRARLGGPYSLEEVLVRHPRLRVYVMHYGSPLVDEMISMLYSHPQLYVDVAGNNWALPREQFHDHLRRLVQAGFGKRILFGSDQMVWPEVIGVAIESIQSADFLTEEQKRDIFYHNAVRFLRLRDTTPSNPHP